MLSKASTIRIISYKYYFVCSPFYRPNTRGEERREKAFGVWIYRIEANQIERRSIDRSMALVGVEVKHAAEGAPEENCSAKPTKQGEGLRHYYSHNIHEHQLLLRQKTHNLNRLEAQRNELNSRGRLAPLTLTLFYSILFHSHPSYSWISSTVRMLREELQLLQEPGSYVGEVVKVMGKNKVLVKVTSSSIPFSFISPPILHQYTPSILGFVIFFHLL